MPPMKVCFFTKITSCMMSLSSPRSRFKCRTAGSISDDGIALQERVPIIPVVSFGGQETLDPIRFERDGPEAAEDTAYVEACQEYHGVARQFQKIEIHGVIQERRTAEAV